MTDYTNYERNMSKDEMALRLTVETALRKCCESECAKLKKELEDIKAAFEIKQRDNLNRSEEIMKLRQDYDCAREKFTTEFNNVTYNYECALKENERLREKVENQKTQLVGVQQALLNRNMKIEALNGENDRLKKELIEAKLKLDGNLTLLKGANANTSALSFENEKLKKQIESLTSENDRLKKEVKETRVVFEPSSYLRDIQAKDEEIKTLRKKNLDLKNENEGWKLKYDHLADVRDARIRELKAMTNAYYGVLNKDYNDLKNENEGLKLKLASNTQPLYIENLNVTYYANGPIWTNEDNEDVEQTA